jgi:hypothetical protein
MKDLMRVYLKASRSPVVKRNGGAVLQRRTFLSQAQRRRATTGAGNGLGAGEGLRFGVVDHHYE